MATLVGMGYKQLQQDECLFIKKTKDGFSLISCHVDDILQACTDRSFFEELKDGLIQVTERWFERSLTVTTRKNTWEWGLTDPNAAVTSK